MASAPYQRFGYRARMSPGRRAAALALALGLVALIIWALIELGVIPPFSRDQSRFPVSFQLAPPAPTAGERTRAQEGARPASHAAPRHAAHPPSTPKPPPPPIPSASPSETPPKLLKLDKDAFASSDISHLPSHAGEGEGEGETGAGKSSHSVYGPGQGPGGAQLYSVAWYREPTRAELAYYLPPGGAPVGWADIECKMIANYHVENCRELSESPVGSGLARSLRLASWQFLVRPPRVNGRAMLGEWVRIHFDFRRDAPAP